MRRFNKKAFAYELPIALTISIGITAIAITAKVAYSVRSCECTSNPMTTSYSAVICDILSPIICAR